MGTSITGYLSPEEIEKTKASTATLAQVGADGSSSAGKFVFFAAFDGTNNNKDNLSLSGNPYQTNVANVFAQADAAQASNPNLIAKYYSGVGTGGGNGNWVNAAFSPTDAVHHAAESAYSDFAKSAADYLQANPTATAADITASVVGFSRGTASEIVFAQLLNERGLVLPDGTVMNRPGF